MHSAGCLDQFRSTYEGDDEVIKNRFYAATHEGYLVVHSTVCNRYRHQRDWDSCGYFMTLFIASCIFENGAKVVELTRAVVARSAECFASLE